MTIAQTAISISAALKSLPLNFAAGLPVMWKGASGCGKTEAAQGYADAQGPDYGLFELNCAISSLPDVIGMPTMAKEGYVMPDGETQTITAATYAYPYFMRDKRTNKPAFMFERGLIVLEEYGQAQPDVKRALAPVMWEKRVGQHKFPKGCDVLILSNRPEDRSGVTKDFDFLVNRRNEQHVKAELSGWLVWAHDHGVTNGTMAYAARNEDKVFANKAPVEQGPWMTPRSLVGADRYIQEATRAGYGLDDDIVRNDLNGIIGTGYTHEYIAFTKIRDQLPTLASILQDPDKAHLPTELDQQLFLVFDLASKCNQQNIKTMFRYLNRMTSDFIIAFVRSAVQRDTTLRSTKEFGDWAVTNQQLLAAVSAG